MASVNVGFAPALSPIVATPGVTAAPQGEGGEPGLFAALLALLGPQPTAEEAATPTSPSTPLVDLIDLPAAAGSEQGKSLLKDLGDALIAINDALAAGQPIDPALEKKLSDSLDAVAVYFGAMTPPALPVDPRISALASGDGIIPELAPALPEVPSEPAAPAASAAVPEAEAFTPALAPILDAAPPSLDIALTPALPAASPAPAADAAPTTEQPAILDQPESVDQPNALLAIVTALFTASQDTAATPAPTASTTPVTAPAAATPAASASIATASPLPAVATPSPAPEPTATTANVGPSPLPAALAKLGKLVEALGETLKAQSPELAAKLQTLANSLENGTLPTALLAELGASSEAAADPEIARIIEALSAPKPAAARAPAPLPFIAPALAVPAGAVAPAKPAPASEPTEAAKPSETDALDAPASVDAPSTGKPTLNANVTRDTALAASEPKSAATTPAPAPTTAPDNTAATAPPPVVVPPARSIHAAYQTPVQQVNLPQVAFEVVRQFEAGNSRFQIRLDPPELGRIDVKLDVDKSGTVNARMTVERPETLDLMQRDHRALQQALQQAGLDTSKTNLEFSLRQNPFAQQGGMGDGRGSQPGFAGRGDGFGADDTAPEAAATTYRGTVSAGGVNLFV
ncbi:MAG: hypothetical protein JWQ89_1877 [Devosia sp.]|uniref:flagellar hook-length control protein FliK n=1 Tax=Devosia sp. TaxID=1871048 RepID=UPI002620BA0A|nr:flagellar hook-length control protein FliK [Devosia sp.]MDB5540150.1 hypothetical protein [Devosia sp.]